MRSILAKSSEKFYRFLPEHSDNFLRKFQLTDFRTQGIVEFSVCWTGSISKCARSTCSRKSAARSRISGIEEWPIPQGKDSRPYGMASDDDDGVYVVATGVQPNVFMGFRHEFRYVLHRDAHALRRRHGQARALPSAVGRGVVRHRHELPGSRHRRCGKVVGVRALSSRRWPAPFRKARPGAPRTRTQTRPAHPATTTSNRGPTRPRLRLTACWAKQLPDAARYTTCGTLHNGALLVSEICRN